MGGQGEGATSLHYPGAQLSSPIPPPKQPPLWAPSTSCQAAPCPGLWNSWLMNPWCKLSQRPTASFQAKSKFAFDLMLMFLSPKDYRFWEGTGHSMTLGRFLQPLWLQVASLGFLGLQRFHLVGSQSPSPASLEGGGEVRAKGEEPCWVAPFPRGWWTVGRWGQAGRGSKETRQGCWPVAPTYWLPHYFCLRLFYYKDISCISARKFKLSMEKVKVAHLIPTPSLEVASLCHFWFQFLLCLPL